jgi:diguanylate cyclase (GGDEF)-like protein
VIWTLTLGVSLAWNIWQEQQETLAMAHIEAQVAYDKDMVYHRWNSLSHGVYVSTEHPLSPPNPYLANVPERDITTPSGKKLTLVNPTYMLRQVHTLEREALGVLSHVTSRKPLRPENYPDAWEDKALLEFEKGAKDMREVADIAGKPYMRFMRPLRVVKSCLDCHGSQGYRDGEVRGGLSISVPMLPLWQIAYTHIIQFSIAHALLWLLSMWAIFVALNKIKKSEALRHTAEEETRMLSITDQLTGLYNRRGFMNLAEHHLMLAQRSQRKMLLMFSDLDGLKRINDTLGHAEGDKAIAEAAELLKEVFRESDIVARIGGDEFAVLAVDSKDLNSEIVDKRVSECLEQHNARPNRPYRLGLSLGCIEYDPHCGYPRTQTGISELLSLADAIMYKQKKARSFRLGETIRR